MIEVEIKVPLNDENKQRLLQGAEFLVSKTLIDIYYDSADYTLSLRDRWLRERNGRFELKQPPVEGSHVGNTAVQRYVEFESEADIKKELNLEGESLKMALDKAEIRPFVTIVSKREKYKKGEFTIDLDETDFGFAVAEVELMVDAAVRVEAAQEKINDFLQAVGIGVVPRQLGKVAEYLRRHDKAHFNALVNAKVITAKY